MSLRDMNGTFLVTRTLPFLVSKSPTPHQEESDFEKEVGSFTAEMTQLQNILQMLEEETIALKIELQSTKERLVELWQENCKQLLDHDTRMAEKEREVQLLRKQLQVRELELARLKLTSLREAPIHAEWY